MTARRCSWCGKLADGQVTAQGMASPIYDCGSDECWERSYRAVRDKVPRAWKLITPASTTGRRRARPAQTGPDLFDHLPRE